MNPLNSHPKKVRIMGIISDLAAQAEAARNAQKPTRGPTPAKNVQSDSAPTPAPADAISTTPAGAVAQESAGAKQSATPHAVASTSPGKRKAATAKTVLEPKDPDRPATAPHTDNDHPTDGAPSARIRSLLGPPQLLSGEDQKRYDEVEAAIHAAVNPQDIFEKFWLRDLVDHEWEILRWRRLTVGLVTATQQEALKQSLYPLLRAAQYRLRGLDAEELARDFVMGKKSSIKEVNEVLSTAGLTWDFILAEAMSLKIGAIESFDCMCKTAEVRRDAQLRQIEHHRKSLGPALRAAINQIEDAEFRVIQPQLKDAA